MDISSCLLLVTYIGKKDPSTPIPTFSDAEFELFLERFQMGYSGSDERYKLWLEMYRPNEEENVTHNASIIHTPVKVSRPASRVALSKPTSSIERLFSKPTPP